MSKLKYLALVTALAVTGPASAGLVDQSVTGSLTFNGSPNAFDPANLSPPDSFVPSGYLNVSGPTVTISASDPEFGYEDDLNRDTADFTDTRLTIRDVVKVGTSTSGNPNDPFEMIFTFTPGLLDQISLISDTFSPQLAFYGVVGNTIKINWDGGDVTEGDEFVAVFEITTNALVPEPATLVLMSVGLAGMMGLGKRRWVSAVSA